MYQKNDRIIISLIEYRFTISINFPIYIFTRVKIGWIHQRKDRIFFYFADLRHLETSKVAV